MKHKILPFAFTIFNLLLSFILYFIPKPFWFNENQILYIFSSIAQVTGGLLGLTFAAYTLIDEKLKKIGDKEKTSEDYSKQVRVDSFEKLIYISVLSICSILLSLLVIALYRISFLEFAIFFMLESVYVFLSLLVEIYSFIKDANPNAIEIRKKEEKTLFDSEYSDSQDYSEKSFGTFITYYNQLEDTLRTLAAHLVNNNNSNLRPQFLEALDILKDKNIISAKCYGQINELRLYRNSLVHSTENDKTVNIQLYEILEKIYSLLSEIVNTYTNNEELNTSLINKLESYVDTLPSKLDQDLIDFFLTHSTATTNEVANVLNISIPMAKRKLQKLSSYGYINRSGNNRYSKWCFTLSKTINSFSFDYSNNNGIYTIGDGKLCFSTKWSKASNISIYVYSDAPNINCIARIKDVSNLFDISYKQLSSLDYSSRSRTVNINDVVVWKNTFGYYLLTQVKKIQDDSRGDSSDLVMCEYRILTN